LTLGFKIFKFQMWQIVKNKHVEKKVVWDGAWQSEV